MITRIVVGKDITKFASDLLRLGSISAYQDLQPEHADTVRVALPLPDNATPSAQAVYVYGFIHILGDGADGVILDDDYLTYGSPLDRQWVTAPQ